VAVGIEAAYKHDDHSAMARFVDGKPRGLLSVMSLVHVFNFLPWMTSLVHVFNFLPLMHREDIEEGG
jgi:hypothetical protein